MESPLKQKITLMSLRKERSFSIAPATNVCVLAVGSRSGKADEDIVKLQAPIWR